MQTIEVNKEKILDVFKDREFLVEYRKQNFKELDFNTLLDIKDQIDSGKETLNIPVKYYKEMDECSKDEHEFLVNRCISLQKGLNESQKVAEQGLELSQSLMEELKK